MEAVLYRESGEKLSAVSGQLSAISYQLSAFSTPDDEAISG
jgi:hypothetical protein